MPERHSQLALDVGENRSLQHTIWFVQRVSWIIFAFVIVVALSGLTGAGGWWSQQIVTAGKVQAVVPRIARWGASDVVTLTFPAARSVNVDLDGAFMTAFDLVKIHPAPIAQQSVGAGLRLIVDGGEEQTATLRLQVVPREAGITLVKIVADGEKLPVRLVILP